MRARPLAVNPAVGGMNDRRPAASAGDRHISEPPLLLEAGEAAFVERALRGEHAFLPAGQENCVELEALGGVDGHDRDPFALARLVIVHDEADMLEEGSERFIFFHRSSELGEVFKAAGRFRGAVGLEHCRIACFLEHDPGELGMGQRVRHLAPAAKVGDEIAERAPRLRGQFVAVEKMGGRDQQRLLALPCLLVDRCDRLVAEAALGGVDNTLEGEVVGGRLDQPQISDCVADLGSLVEAEAADDLVGEPDRDEALFELARLELGSNEDCGFIEAEAIAMQAFDLVADPARLFRAIPDADGPHFLTIAGLGPQGLAEAASVMGDKSIGSGKDVRCRAVILLEADDLRAGEILFEAQDVRDLGASPGVDRLIIVADARRGCGEARRSASATRTAPGWCPDIRRRGGSGSARDSDRGHLCACGR